MVNNSGVVGERLVLFSLTIYDKLLLLIVCNEKYNIDATREDLIMNKKLLSLGLALLCAGTHQEVVCNTGLIGVNPIGENAVFSVVSAANNHVYEIIAVAPTIHQFCVKTEGVVGDVVFRLLANHLRHSVNQAEEREKMKQFIKDNALPLNDARRAKIKDELLVLGEMFNNLVENYLKQWKVNHEKLTCYYLISTILIAASILEHVAGGMILIHQDVWGDSSPLSSTEQMDFIYAECGIKDFSHEFAAIKASLMSKVATGVALLR